MSTNPRDAHVCAIGGTSGIDDNVIEFLCDRCCVKLCIHCDTWALEHLIDKGVFKCLYDATEFEG